MEETVSWSTSSSSSSSSSPRSGRRMQLHASSCGTNAHPSSFSSSSTPSRPDVFPLLSRSLAATPVDRGDLPKKRRSSVHLSWQIKVLQSPYANIAFSGLAFAFFLYHCYPSSCQSIARPLLICCFVHSSPQFHSPPPSSPRRWPISPGRVLE
ncbi:uncharacterized protein BO88DRAFT_100583 [Aspergillus vadensis CBS 113365]|uniref:Uncharacterized protein n=1 Tax=Aspergillus vadensis (strain CBS 113365 / IMI 142717 / IBT 24658) TaxID=1448311 RepID=A0A319C5J5_ASPVC|nr:hypothetical protein BO88DRAFT_100583 [Aspergillus vadensis CBS 113365]PYH73583.1 hypothetical protein BO88DRAFT_100583 [Aspergillus vadensis CBS 113365]